MMTPRNVKFNLFLIKIQEQMERVDEAEEDYQGADGQEERKDQTL